MPTGVDPPDRPSADPPREAIQRWRLVVSRERLEPADAGRPQQLAWETALRRSGLPLVGLDAPGGRPRLAAAAPLAAGVAGEAELYDIWLTRRLPRWEVREALVPVLPAPCKLVDVYDAWLGEPALPGQVVASVYRVAIEPRGADAARLAAAAVAIEEARSLPRRRTRGDRVIDYDLRPMLERLSVRTVGARTEVVMTLRHDPERGIGRPDEVLAELSDRLGQAVTASRLTRERVVLGADRPAMPPAPGRSGAR